MKSNNRRKRFLNSRKYDDGNRKKSIENYTFCVESNKEALDFEIALDFLLNHTKKTYSHRNYISESL